MKKAFTLIELLVVVLIIGILAAIALPQYQKAVMKSQYATIKNLTRSLANAQEIYYLANNEYADELDKLDIQLPGGQLDTSTTSQYDYEWGMCKIYTATGNVFVKCSQDKAGLSYQIHLMYSPYLPGTTHCVASAADLTAPQNQICKAETQDPNPYNGGTWYSYTYL